jgi:hypothetical protein
MPRPEFEQVIYNIKVRYIVASQACPGRSLYFDSNF